MAKRLTRWIVLFVLLFHAFGAWEEIAVIAPSYQPEDSLATTLQQSFPQVSSDFLTSDKDAHSKFPGFVFTVEEVVETSEESEAFSTQTGNALAALATLPVHLLCNGRFTCSHLRVSPFYRCALYLLFEVFRL